MTVQPFIDFGGRWIVVTGASSGLGRAIAAELARRSARLLLVGRNEAALEETAGQLPAGVGRVATLDLRQTEAILPLVRKHARDHGRIYGLCHCAGVVETRPLTSFKADRFRELTDVNVTAGLELSKAVARRDVMVDEGGGRYCSSPRSTGQSACRARRPTVPPRAPWSPRRARWPWSLRG